LIGPPVTKTVLALDALKVGIDGLEFFAYVSHVRIDGVVGNQGLHGRVH
jgi:hypothetical protein